MIGFIKQYWRIIVLTLALIGSLGLIFSPVVPGLSTPNDTDSNLTAVQYSVDLSGGTRIRAPLVGVTAENITSVDQTPAEIERQIASNIDNTTRSRVIVRRTNATEYSAEVTTRGTTTDDLQNSIDESNFSAERVRNGVTTETREEAVGVLQAKINQAGLSGGSVRTVQSIGERELILVEVPQSSRQNTIDLIASRGEVRVDIYYSETENGSVTYQRERAVLERDDFRTIGTPSQGTRQTPSAHVPVSISDGSAARFQESVVDRGVAQPQGTTCTYQESPQKTDPCMLTVVDGELIHSAGMNVDLATSMIQGTWSRDPNFLLLTGGDYGAAQELALNLRAGELPAPMDLRENGPGEITFVAPQQGDDFKITAVIIAIASSLAVSLVVGIRYRDVRVALPMLFTAFSEIAILIAIASVLGYPVGLSVIAGLVAVIGTGVDDLIIIADRVIGGSTPPKHSSTFSKRFRKALWVIISAAATTILAIGPLAVLQLQDLQGFAIFTIIGVVVGVTITRPAYGDILRYIFVER